MAQILLTTSAFLLSLLPPAALHYSAFTFFISPRQKKKLFFLYALFFAAETAVIFSLFLFQILPFHFSSYKRLLYLAWIPYFLVTVWIIRPFWAQHLYIFSLHSIFSITLHTLIMYGLFCFIRVNDYPFYYSIQLLCYTGLFMLCFPVLRRYFITVFVRFRHVQNHYFWNYICLLPLLIFVDETFFAVSQQQPVGVAYFLPRMILALAAFIIALSVLRGLSRSETDMRQYRRQYDLSVQMQSMRQYTEMLRQSQQQIQDLQDQKDCQLQHIAALIRIGDTAGASRYIRRMDATIAQTKVETWCGNPILNAALTVYMDKARQLHIPITAKLAIPPAMDMDADLAMVLSNLLENAIHASQLQDPENRHIMVIARCQDHLLNLLVQNRFDAPVPLGSDGLPQTDQKGHGLGMRSLAYFQMTYHASVLCSQDAAWFKTYMQVPWKQAPSRPSGQDA